MEDIKNISKALVEFHKAVSGRVGFDSVNPFYKSKYASLGAVIDHINKNAPKFGLGWVQLPVSEPEVNMVGVETIVLHESGETIKSRILLPYNTSLARVNKDGEVSRFDIETQKIAQEVGSVITYLRRYGLAAAFGLYADEDTDANPAETEAEMVVMKPAVKAEAKPKAKAQRPYSPEVLVANLKKMATKSEPASQKDRQTIVASVIQLLGDDDADLRHEMQQVLFGHKSIAEVEPELISAAIAWLNPVWDKDSKLYFFNEFAVEEFNKVREEYAI